MLDALMLMLPTVKEENSHIAGAKLQGMKMTCSCYSQGNGRGHPLRGRENGYHLQEFWLSFI